MGKRRGAVGGGREGGGGGWFGEGGGLEGGGGSGGGVGGGCKDQGGWEGMSEGTWEGMWKERGCALRWAMSGRRGMRGEGREGRRRAAGMGSVRIWGGEGAGRCGLQD